MRARRQQRIRKCPEPKAHAAIHAQFGEGTRRLFTCRTCRIRVCMWCEGGTDFQGCDRCWVKRERRMEKQRKAARL